MREKMQEPDAGTLATIASIIAAFGVAMLFFRIQREIDPRRIEEQSRQTGEDVVWIPWADWLLIAATLVCLLLVILPIALSFGRRLAAAGSAAAAVMVAGYVFAILGHYRILFGRHRTRPRTNPEPAEIMFVAISALAAIGVFLFSIVTG
jgi:uncharacterized protein (DUF697 family)